MTKTYGDIVDAMIEAAEDGLSADKVVITDGTMKSFLRDSDFSEEDHKEQKDKIGTNWRLPVETGDGNYLLTEDGTRIDL